MESAGETSEERARVGQVRRSQQGGGLGAYLNTEFDMRSRLFLLVDRGLALVGCVQVRGAIRHGNRVRSQKSARRTSM